MKNNLFLKQGDIAFTNTQCYVWLDYTHHPASSDARHHTIKIREGEAVLILSFSESYEITKQVNVLTHTGALGRICINELYRPIR